MNVRTRSSVMERMYDTLSILDHKRQITEALWVQLTEKYVCIVLSLYVDKCHFCEATLFRLLKV